jgi:hypothetical protein
MALTWWGRGSLAGVVCALVTTSVGAQATSQVRVFVEPLAGGVELLRPAGDRWWFGAALGVGPSEGVTVAGLPRWDADPWVTGYLTAAFELPAAVELAVSPIGAIAVIGSDFGVVFPSAQLQLSRGAGRFRLGTALRVIRVAEAGGRATWWTEWLPLRVSVTL